MSIQPRELGLWLTGRWPLLGLHWQHMTSHRKPSTPARECLLGSTADRPHTMAGTCVRRPIRQLSIQPRELGLWLTGRWPLLGLHWQHTTSHRKPSTPARECLLGSTVDRPCTTDCWVCLFAFYQPCRYAISPARDPTADVRARPAFAHECYRSWVGDPEGILKDLPS